MPNARIWTTDENGNDVLHTTMVFDKDFKNLIEIIHHVPEEVRAEQRAKNTERIKQAMEDIARQNPNAVIALQNDLNR